MKRYLLSALLIGLVACSTSAPAPSPGPAPAPAPAPSPAPPPAKTVNDLVLTPTQLGVPLTTYDIGPYSMQSVMVGNSIYFANYSNTAKPQFFARYDIPSNTFSSPLAKSSNVCGCGYMSKLVTDGTNIFYIANDATKYTASTNSWSDLTFPPTAKDNSGEAGVAYLSGKIYFVGGRTASTLFKYYDIGQDKWFTAPNYLYATSSSEVAIYKDRLYVLGGQGAPKKMAFFSTTGGTWTPLSDIPFTLSTSYQTEYAAVLGDDLFVLQGGSVYIYDLVKDVWATTPVTVNGLPSYGSLFSDGLNLYVAGKNASNIPAVTKISVSFK